MPGAEDIGDEQTDLHDLRKNIGSMIGRIAQNKFFAPSRTKREEFLQDRYQKNSPVKVPRLLIPPSGHLDFAIKKSETEPKAKQEVTPVEKMKEAIEKELYEERQDVLVSGRGSASSRCNTVRKLKAEKQESSVKIRRSLDSFSEMSKERNQYDLFSENHEHIDEEHKVRPQHLTKEKPLFPFGARVNLSLKNDKTVEAFSRMKTNKLNEPLRSVRKLGSGSSDSMPVNDLLSQAKLIHSQKVSHQIPCLVFRSDPSDRLEGGFYCLAEENLSSKLVIFFHCNGEDLAEALPTCRQIAATLNVNFVAVEYPGYSVYQGRETNEENILKDAEAVVEYMLEKLGIEPKDVIIFGRSIGSGPSIHVASKFEVGGLLLISAFSSIREVARDKVGNALSYLVKERFNNLSKIERVKCPVTLVHGQKDELVSVEHALKLHGSLRVSRKARRPGEAGHSPQHDALDIEPPHASHPTAGRACFRKAPITRKTKGPLGLRTAEPADPANFKPQWSCFKKSVAGRGQYCHSSLC